jgi:uncharacterized membrane protein
MAIVGRLHPLLIHFPIALVIAAGLAECAALVTAKEGWRTVAVGNIRAGALFAVLAAITGWRFALAPDMESPLLEWHRWLGIVGAGSAIAAALATGAVSRRWTRLVYRLALALAGILVAVTGHIGGLLVWGVNFLVP